MSDEPSMTRASAEALPTGEFAAGAPTDDRGGDPPVDAIDREKAAAAQRHIADLVLAELQQRRGAPRATYRCQFHGGFGFREAAAIVPYLRGLGISHVYASPILQARPGSDHGYDACDHQALDQDLGGAEAFDEWRATLAQHGLGLILDIVPNHMSTHTANRWWSDVLENGQNSPFAKYFDIDWNPVKLELHGKVLLPMLGNQYGNVLEAGELRIAYQEGAFFVHYADRLLPTDPRTTTGILSARLDELRAALSDTPEALAEYESILTALEHLPAVSDTRPEAMVERQRDKEVIKRRLRDLTAASPIVEQFISRNAADINGTAGDPASFDRLDAVLAVQPYRLCHWKAASDEVNYRRFFDVNELAALCMEDPEVFFHSHRLVLRLAAEGAVSGLRIDHIDGLYAPENYLWRLQWAYLAALAHRVWESQPAEASQVPPDQSAAAGSSTAAPNGSPAASSPVFPKPDLGAAAGSGAAWVDIAPPLIVELCRRLGLPEPADDDWVALLGTRPITVESPPARGDAAAGALPGAGELPLFVVVEKILGPHEPLPECWPTAGTIGYDFLQMCDGLFVADDGWRQLKRDYTRLTSQTAPFDSVARDNKRLILRVAMGSELQMLAHQLNHISEQHRQSRDFTLNLLRYALREILVCFPVYRIYPGPRGVSERDRRFVTQAVAMAKRRNPAIDAGAFDFVRGVLLLEHPDGLSEASIRERELFAGRFQQVTSPVMAKGVEDTSFYVYCPLLSVNEVGNGPESPTSSPGVFHAWNQQRAACYPHAMLAASTHDTKRSEDVRARLNVLSEMPRVWRAAMQRWLRLNRRRRTEVDGQDAPSRSDENLFYQSLIGIWPVAPPDSATLAALVERMRAYMSKATHEAKEHTSWISPNEAYDRAVDNFVTSSMHDRRDNRFLTLLRAWLPRIAEPGFVNGLAALTLRLTCPGFPDVYNGQELWSFRLVDPDNRAPVDYSERQRLLAELQLTASGSADDVLAFTRQLAANLADPRTKLYVTWRLLTLRQRLSDLFASGRYVPLSISGERAEHAVAFARVPQQAPTGEGASGPNVVVIVPRLVARLIDAGSDGTAPWRVPLGADVWRETQIEVPPELAGTKVDVLTGVRRDWRGTVPLADLFADFPVVVLSSE